MRAPITFEDKPQGHTQCRPPAACRLPIPVPRSGGLKAAPVLETNLFCRCRERTGSDWRRSALRACAAATKRSCASMDACGRDVAMFRQPADSADTSITRS
eukprot:3277078-Pleurochrysis_carterae.AAC.3